MMVKILLVGMLAGTAALAQSEHHEGSHSEHSEGSHSAHHENGDAAYPCPMLQAEHDQMTQKMAAMDKKVVQLARAMKSASGDQKVEAMEALLDTLVKQRSSLHNEMISMLPKMMDWVARHSGDTDHECSH